MSSTPSVKKNFALSSAYQVLNLIVPFITAPYISRVLGAEGVGIYSFTSSIATYFTMFAALGTMSYGAREIARARDNKNELSRLFWEIEALVIVSTLLCVSVWAVWIVFAPEYNNLYLILTMTLLNTIADISWFFTGLEQFKYIVIRNSIVKIVGVVLLFVFIREKTDLTLYVLLMTATTLLGSMSMWMYMPKMISRIDWRTIRLKRHFKETLVYFIPTIATSIYTILNKVLLGFMGGDIRENGYYEQTTKIVMMAQALTFTALNSVLSARMSYLFVENKIDEIHQRIDKSLHYILFAGMGIVFGLIAVAPVFVPWFFGPEFTEAIVLLQLLSPIILIIGVSNCLGSQYYTPAGLRKKSAQYIVVGAIVNLILNILLIPNFGAKGAVIGSLLAEGTITVLYLYNCNGYVRVGQLLRNGWKKCLAAVVMFSVIKVVGMNVSNYTAQIITSVVMGAIVYIATLMIMRDKFVVETLRFGYNRMMRK